MNVLDTQDSLIRSSARRAMSEMAPQATLGKDGESMADVVRKHWETAVELGWTGLIIDAEDGGYGGGYPEMVELCEELGAGLFCGPFLASAVLAPSLCRLSRSRGIDLSLPAGLVEGEACISLATPLPQPGSWLVEYPDIATHVLFFEFEKVQSSLFLVRSSIQPASSISTTVRPSPLDPTCPMAQVTWSPGACDPQRSLAVTVTSGELAGILLPAHLAIAGECVGIGSAALERALKWVSERRQFGRSIGGFQAIKHRLADAYVDLRKAMVCVRTDALRGDSEGAACSRVLGARAALRVARDYMQLLGGAGMSWEVDAHLYLKRAMRLNAILGGSSLLHRTITDRFIQDLLDHESPPNS
jgi:alkylation response protein AidB-like acyl-CoA dehydrogenase